MDLYLFSVAEISVQLLPYKKIKLFNIFWIIVHFVGSTKKNKSKSIQFWKLFYT